MRSKSIFPRLDLHPALSLTLFLLAAVPAAGQTPCDDNPWLPTWQPNWHPLFQGIDWMSACTTRLPSSPQKTGVRTQKANGLRIDLQAPGIQLFSPPKAPGAGTLYDTQPERASDFLCDWGLQVAVNANFFWPCCTEEQYPLPIPPPVRLCGLAVSNGQLVSELSSVPTAANAGVSALLVTGSNQASFATLTQSSSLPLGVCTAVAGSPQPNVSDYCPQGRVPGPAMLLAGGVNQGSAALDANPPERVAARTAVATSENGRFLYLLTIDGTDGGTNGAGFYDEAVWLLVLGAWNGINLDGGGSTTMVAQLQPGQVTVLNNPSETCTERYVGTFLGVKAAPLEKPLLPLGCGILTCSGPPRKVPACPPTRGPVH